MAAVTTSNPPGFWSDHFCQLIEGSVPYDFARFKGYARSIIQYRLNGNPQKHSIDLEKLVEKIFDVYVVHKQDTTLSERARMLKEACFQELTEASIDYPQKSKAYLTQKVIPSTFRALGKEHLLTSETISQYLNAFYIASVKPETIENDVEALSDLPGERVDELVKARTKIGASWYPLVQRREVTKDEVENLVVCLEKHLKNPASSEIPTLPIFQIVYTEYLELVKMYPENKRLLALEGIIKTVRNFILKNNF